MKPDAPTLYSIANAAHASNYIVDWSSTTGATSYVLQEDDNTSFSSPTTRYTGGATEYSISGQGTGTWYYRVKASNSGGDSSWSVTRSTGVRPESPALYAISNTDGDGTYTVDWGSVAGATSYILEEDDNSAFNSPTTRYSGAATEYDISAQAAGTWYYRVRASNSAGDSDWSTSRSTAVNPTAPLLYGINNPDSGEAYVVDWTSPSGAENYTLEEDDNSSFASPIILYSGSVSQYSVSNQVAGTWYYRARASNAGGDSDWSNTESVTVTDSAEGDAYEPDDTCAQARAILTDGTVQQRTFHKQADEDWAVFQATAGVTYRVEGQAPVGSSADVNLEIYAQCADDPLDEQHNSFAPGVRLEFTAPADGPLYLRWLNHDSTVYEDDVTYHISVQALAAEAMPGAVIIVAGRDRVNDPLQPNIHYAAEQFYQAFQAYGYPAERIYYLATNPALPGYSAPATAANLQAAITTWAAARVGPERPFTLYMIDHGKQNELYLDGPAGQTVSPAQVDAWLSELETAHPGLKVNVIVEACHSGSFIRLPQTVSKPGRVVISSTGVGNLAYSSAQGAIFSDHFTVALYQGQSLYQSFENARWATQAAYPHQTPWLDDDGDGLPNQPDDGQVAATRGFAYAGTFSGDVWPPHIFAAVGPSGITQGQGVIRAEVQDDEQVDRVWAVIYPPSYRPPESGEELVSEVLPTIVLQVQGNNQFAATYTGFDELGVYRIVVYAEDDGGREARPVAVEVRTGWGVYLPLVARQ